MKYHELEVAAKTSRKRVGRGISAGGGKTAGRGTKGQKARTGKKIKPGFEGGQTKLAMRLPKARGFTRIAKQVYTEVTIDQLEKLSDTTITNASLVKAKLVRNEYSPVKVLGGVEPNKKLTIKLQAASAAVIAKIEKAGGSFTVVEVAKKKVKKAESK
jgi:large subunit ribosomal protein L15